MPTSENQSASISTAQGVLGAPEDRHYPKKDALLKISVGNMVSNLALTSKWDENLGDYGAPTPTYSCYVQERVRGEDGAMSTDFTIITFPRTPETFRALSEHFAQLAKAVEGLALEATTSGENDLDRALNALAAFKSAPAAKK